METWLPVKGWENRYSISDLGRVRGETSGHGGYIAGRILIPVADRDGYLCVCLFRPGIKRSVRIHALVAQAFIGHVKRHAQVNHKNGNKRDNQAINLEYVTCQENLRHAREVLGRQGRPRPGELHHNSKLSNIATQTIRSLASQGICQSIIAKQFGVSPSNISRIVNMKHRKERVP